MINNDAIEDSPNKVKDFLLPAEDKKDDANRNITVTIAGHRLSLDGSFILNESPLKVEEQHHIKIEGDILHQNS